MPSVEALAGRILTQEGKPPDKPITFHMTPFVPVEGMEGVNIRFLIMGPLGPTEMLRPGVYVETDMPPARYKPSPDGIPDAIKEAIERHINAGPKDRLSLINPCLTPLGCWMFQVGLVPKTAPVLCREGE